MTYGEKFNSLPKVKRCISKYHKYKDIEHSWFDNKYAWKQKLRYMAYMCIISSMMKQNKLSFLNNTPEEKELNEIYKTIFNFLSNPIPFYYSPLLEILKLTHTYRVGGPHVENITVETGGQNV